MLRRNNSMVSGGEIDSDYSDYYDDDDDDDDDDDIYD